MVCSLDAGSGEGVVKLVLGRGKSDKDVAEYTVLVSISTGVVDS